MGIGVEPFLVAEVDVVSVSSESSDASWTDTGMDTGDDPDAALIVIPEGRGAKGLGAPEPLEGGDIEEVREREARERRPEPDGASSGLVDASRASLSLLLVLPVDPSRRWCFPTLVLG